MTVIRALGIMLPVAVLALHPEGTDGQQPEAVYPLSDFGPLDSPAHTQATMDRMIIR